jgi:chromosomal replication initiation ATPase DnaA
METWDEMELRHGIERANMVKRLTMRAHQNGLLRQPFMAPMSEFEKIVGAMALSNGVTVEDLRGPDRRHDICEVRFKVWAALRAANYSYPHIGRYFRRDHTTILSGLKKIDAYEKIGAYERKES